MFNVQIAQNGALKITATNAGRAWLKSEMLDKCEIQILPDILEPYSTNGSYTFFDAADGRPFVGLTGAPCIAETLDYSDTGEPEIIGRFWYFEPYQVENPLESLKNSGRVFFQLAH